MLRLLVLAHPDRYSYMIDNVILLITGTLHDRDIHEVDTHPPLPMVVMCFVACVQVPPPWSFPGHGHAVDCLNAR
jgi:hypothetical protein